MAYRAVYRCLQLSADVSGMVAGNYDDDEVV